MKINPVRYSSAVGEVLVMSTFKVKYSHKIFDIRAVRELTELLFEEAFIKYNIRRDKLAFDSDHAHMIHDIGLYSKPEIAKKLKGYVGYHLLRMMPWLKQNYFWGSGLWNPAYDIRSVTDITFYRRYLDKQKYARKGQKMLTAF